MIELRERPVERVELPAAEREPDRPTWRPPGGARYWLTVLVLAALAAGGIAALVALALAGPEPRSKWAYPAAALAFVLSAASGAPVLALATRLTRAYWGVTLRRAAELFAVAGLVTAPLQILLLFQLPDFHGRPSIWFDWPGAPLVWDSIAAVGFAILGLALLYTTARPDLAVARDAGVGSLAGRLALGWRGTTGQWRVQERGVVLLGVLYLALYTTVHLLVASDLALSLVPHWHSALFPPYHAISGLQAGVAAVVVAAGLLCRSTAGRPTVPARSFRPLAKLLLVLSLIWFWLTWSEFITFWYGRTPAERWLLDLLMFGPSLPLFLASFALNCLLPFLLLIWNPVRASVGATVAVAVAILLGNLVDRVRTYAAAWSVVEPTAQPHQAPLPSLPAPLAPGLADLLVLAGIPAAVALLYLLALRLVPPVSGWEQRAVEMLTVERRLGRARATVVAKPS